MLPRWIGGSLGWGTRVLLWSELLLLGGLAVCYGIQVIWFGAGIADQPRWDLGFAAGLALGVLGLLAGSFWRAVQALLIYGLICLVGEGVRYGYVWGHDRPTVFHWDGALLGGWILAVADQVIARLASVFPQPGKALILVSRTLGWTSFRNTFIKRTRWPINAWYIGVILIYILYYLNEELKKTDPSSLHDAAVWIDAHVFSFPLFGEDFKATDIIPLEILGYLLYGVAEFLYRRCPRMLSTKEAAYLTPPDVFARTLQHHGASIPSRDLAQTMKDLVEPYVGGLPTEAADRLRRSQQYLREIAVTAGTAGVPAAAGAAADMARELPDSSAHRLNELGEELFNTFYPRTRIAIHVLVVASALLGLVPVIGKTILVWAPRLARSL